MDSLESSASSKSHPSLHPPRRIMLWTTARTLSTVLCKCLSFVPDIRIFYEPYLAACMLGPERLPLDKTNRYDQKCIDKYSEERVLNKGLPDEDSSWFSTDVSTYGWVKHQLESACESDTQAIFCKDVAFAITNHYKMIPDGFQHIFLIRNPYKVLVSHKRLCAGLILGEKNVDEVDFHDIPVRLTGGRTCGFQELLHLYTHIKNHYHVDPVIIDADDLQNHTSSILRQLLEDVIGVPYKESYLRWGDDNLISKQWVMPKPYGYNSIADEGAHTKGFTSTSIEPAKEPPSRESLTPDLIKVIDNVMPIYEKLFSLRLKP